LIIVKNVSFMPGWEMMAKFFDENVTVLSRLCGGGNLYLDTVASIIAFIVLWAVRHMENYLPREHRATLQHPLARLARRSGFPPTSARRKVDRHELGRAIRPARRALQPELRTEMERANRSRSNNAPGQRTAPRPSGVRSLSWTE
jgi:hypothetical protein